MAQVGKRLKIDIIIRFVSCMTIFCLAFLILAALVLPILAWRSTCLPCRPSVVFIRSGSPGVKFKKERKMLTYNVGKDCTTEENHMPPARRVFDPDFEFLWLFNQYKQNHVGKRAFCFWRLHSVSQDPHVRPWSTITA